MNSAGRIGVIVLLVFASCQWTVARLEARGRRGNTAAQRKAMQQRLEKQEAVILAEQKKDKEVMDRFDTNKNGKIDPSEKTGWDKYWREVRLGNTPHPYTTITAKDLQSALATVTGKKKPAAPKTSKTTTSMASSKTK